MTNRPRLNVVLLVLDSVRADHLSAYGYHKNTSPNISDIAKEGVIFENTFSAAPWTVPSHASIFTGKYPSYHKCVLRNLQLGKQNTTLAEILRRNRYRTMAITACPLLRPEYGIGRGFDDFINMGDLSIDKLLRKAPKEVVRTLISGPDKFTFLNNETVKKLLNKNSKSGKPFFLFVNYFNCHAPYNPPKPFKRKFCDRLDESRLYIWELILNRTVGAREKDSNSKVNKRKIRFLANGSGGYSFMAGRIKVSEEEWRIVRSLYDGEIAYLDYRIGELVNFLRKEELFDETLLIITSDHGENFGEHGFASHGYCLYDTLIRVPLIITCPSLIQSKRRISSLVSTIDIFPTVIRALGLMKTPSDIQGVSLYPFGKQKFHRFVCAEFEKGHTRIGVSMEKGLKCIRTKSHKYIVSSNQEEELYNLQNDPFEKRNLINECPDKARLLRTELERIMDISYFGPEESIYMEDKHEQEQLIRRLKQLGYI